MSIIRAVLHRAWDRFVPGTGKRRAGTSAATVEQPEEPHTVASPLPVHRSPYGLFGCLDGHETALVRPYVLVAEGTA
jgi:hypothetical protein